MTPGEIYWVDFHDSNSRVQSGLRPAIAMQDDAAFPMLSPLVVAVPLTSKIAALRFPATLRIDPSPTNGLASVSIALGFQIRAIDRSWIGAKAGDLEQTKLNELLLLLDRLMGR